MALQLHAPAPAPSKDALRARKKFLRYFRGGFRDETYLEWERDYKESAAKRWESELGARTWRTLEPREIARRAVAIESRTNLLFSFEKMALRDAVKDAGGARAFAEGLFRFVQRGPSRAAFEEWCEVVASLPRKKTRVLTWPVVTVFGFLARPEAHLFVKPTVTRRAAEAYGYELDYRSRPNWDTYASVLDFAETIRRDVRDLRPRDMIDLQSFIWVQGSDEYPT